MLHSGDHLYILCGTNQWVYNSDVYDIDLQKRVCNKIGSTFYEIENVEEDGRLF